MKEMTLTADQIKALKKIAKNAAQASYLKYLAANVNEQTKDYAAPRLLGALMGSLLSQGMSIEAAAELADPLTDLLPRTDLGCWSIEDPAEWLLTCARVGYLLK